MYEPLARLNLTIEVKSNLPLEQKEELALSIDKDAIAQVVADFVRSDLGHHDLHAVIHEGDPTTFVRR